MTRFKPGDKVLLPEWLGGGEVVISTGGQYTVVVDVESHSLNIRADYLKKVLTPEPTEIGYIHTDSSGFRYILSDFSWPSGRPWLRFTGGHAVHGGMTWFTWQETSN